MTEARRVALEVLRRIERDGAYANLVLGPVLDRSDLDPLDRRFATELVYGTTRMRRACDALVDRFVTTAPDADVRTVLRLGAYQLAFAGVPAHAAVSETVSLVPRRVRGFVNAVLRNVARTPMVWPSDAVRLSCPDWILDRLADELGRADAVTALERMNLAPPVSVRDDGYVQDLASRWVAAAVEPAPGALVLDACAAPGGKATALAAAGARVVAADVRPGRVSLLTGNATGRSGSGGIDVVAADATSPPFASRSFDAVLLDAPCSGLGALRRRPDARWRITPADVVRLAALQAAMLSASARLVRPGGSLVYSVCTLTAAESVDHPVPPGFEVDDRPPPIGPWREFRHGWRLLPQDADTDGMVLVRLRAVRSGS